MFAAPVSSAPPAVPWTAPAGALRWVRGAAVAGSATGLALLGHGWAGGSLPPAIGLASVLVLAVALAVGLSGRRWTLAPLVSVIVGAQVVFHVAFGGLAGSVTVHQGQHAATNVSHPDMDSHSGLAMAFAHVAAVLVTAWLLRCGEDVCWRLVVLLGRRWLVPRAVGCRPVSSELPLHLARAADVPRPTLLMLEDVAVRRGPPVRVAA
jgi:hypothetical protein